MCTPTHVQGTHAAAVAREGTAVHEWRAGIGPRPASRSPASGESLETPLHSAQPQRTASVLAATAPRTAPHHNVPSACSSKHLSAPGGVGKAAAWRCTMSTWKLYSHSALASSPSNTRYAGRPPSRMTSTALRVGRMGRRADLVAPRAALAVGSCSHAASRSSRVMALPKRSASPTRSRVTPSRTRRAALKPCAKYLKHTEHGRASAGGTSTRATHELRTQTNHGTPSGVPQGQLRHARHAPSLEPTRGHSPQCHGQACRRPVPQAPRHSQRCRRRWRRGSLEHAQ